MTDRRTMRRNYVMGVIVELQRFGYSEKDAKAVFIRHYRGLKRSYDHYLNIHDFAMLIDEIERALNRKYNPNDPNQIYVGHIRDLMIKANQQETESSKIFRISEEMEQKIKKWDSCVAADVSGAKFAYIFIPTGLGLVIKVQCDVCKRELDLSEW
jgi:hypothetical protein